MSQCPALQYESVSSLGPLSVNHEPVFGHDPGKNNDKGQDERKHLRERKQTANLQGWLSDHLHLKKLK